MQNIECQSVSQSITFPYQHRGRLSAGSVFCVNFHIKRGSKYDIDKNEYDWSNSRICQRALAEERARHALLTDHAERCAYWPQFKGLMVAVDKGCQRSCLDAFGAPIKAQRQCA